MKINDFCYPYGTFWGVPGSPGGGSGRTPGGVLGRLGAVLGASWAVFGASWGNLGGVLGRLMISEKMHHHHHYPWELREPKTMGGSTPPRGR